MDLTGCRTAASRSSQSGSRPAGGGGGGGSCSSGTNPQSSPSSAADCSDSGRAPPPVPPDAARHGASAPCSSSSTHGYTFCPRPTTAAVLPASEFHFDLNLTDFSYEGWGPIAAKSFNVNKSLIKSAPDFYICDEVKTCIIRSYGIGRK